METRGGGYPRAMHLPGPRGPVSDAVITALRHGDLPGRVTIPAGDEIITDDDVQLGLWVLHELHYAGFEEVGGDREWDPDLLALRTRIWAPLETALREATAERVAAAREAADEIPDQLFALAKDEGGPSLASYLQRTADREQFAEFLAHRSVSQLKESDAAGWALPRLRSGAKAVLAELLYDEYGAGRPAHIHSRLYAEAMAGSGLDPDYGRYASRLPGTSLAIDNVATFLGLNHRLRGAAVGHLAAVEATSSLPCRKLVGGAERLAFPPEVARYFDEHVEADAVHEQLAVRGVCGSLVADEPELVDDVLFGAAACLEVDARFGSAVLSAFQEGRSSLLEVAA